MTGGARSDGYRRARPGAAGADGEWPPLVAGLVSHVGEGYLGFHMPGHHQGRAAWAPWRDLLGEAAFSLDLTELPGLDNIQDPQGIIREAADEAAAFFGAAETHFLVNGASAGILAVLLASCQEGGAMRAPAYGRGHGAVLVPGTAINRWCTAWSLAGRPRSICRCVSIPDWGCPACCGSRTCGRA